MNSGLYALATAQREGQAALPYVEDVARAAARQMRGRLVNRAGADFPVRYPPSKVLSLRKLLEEPCFRDATIYAPFRIQKSLPPGLLVLEGKLVNRFIALMLGEEPGSAPLPTRDVTELELKVAERMVRDLLSSVGTALAEAIEGELKPDRIGCQRKVLEGIPLDMVILAVPFELGPADEPFGQMVFTIPTQAGSVFVGTPASRPVRERNETGRILKHALPVQVEVVAELARLQLTVGRMRSLQVGEIIPLGASVAASLRVNEHKVMDVEAGQSGGRHSVRVLRRSADASGPMFPRRGGE